MCVQDICIVIIKNLFPIFIFQFNFHYIPFIFSTLFFFLSQVFYFIFLIYSLNFEQFLHLKFIYNVFSLYVFMSTLLFEKFIVLLPSDHLKFFLSSINTFAFRNQSILSYFTFKKNYVFIFVTSFQIPNLLMIPFTFESTLR